MTIVVKDFFVNGEFFGRKIKCEVWEHLLPSNSSKNNDKKRVDF